MLAVAIIGQKWLAKAVFKSIHALPNVHIEGVVSPNQDDRLAKVAQEYFCPCYDLDNCPTVDLALAVHYQQYIPAHIRERFRLGVLAYHPSLLPRHRGRDAVRWAIHMKESITGGTLYWMDDGADTGNIEEQDWCHIHPNETPKELWLRALAPMGANLFTKAVTRLATGASPRSIPQDKTLATFEPAFNHQKLRE